MATKETDEESGEKGDSTFPKRLWVLPFLSIVISLMTTGVMRGDGLFFVAIMEEEQESRLVSSLPFSVVGLSAIISAPLTGFLGPRMSFRGVATFGHSLFIFGLVCCYFTTSVYAITFFTFIRGIGSQLFLTILPHLIVTTFKKHRATAQGISSMGVPLGGFFWPFIIQFFLKYYGLGGAYLLCAGVALHAYVAIFFISCYLFPEKKSGEFQMYYPKKRPVNLKTACSRSNNSNSSCKNEICKSIEMKKGEEDFSDNSLNSTLSKNNIINEINSRNGDFFSQNNNKNEVVTANHRTSRETELEADASNKDTASQRKMLLNVLTEHGFYLLVVTNIVNTFVQNAFNQTIVDFMHDNGVLSDKAILPLTVYSFGGLIGRLCLGWITDQNFVSAQMFKATTLFITASSFLTASFITWFHFQLFCYFITGIMQAAILVINMSQYAEYFKKEEILIAMSAGRFIQGFFQICRSLIVGAFRDYLQSYKHIFVILSVLLYISSSFWVFENCRVNRRNRGYSRVNTVDPDEGCK